MAATSSVEVAVARLGGPRIRHPDQHQLPKSPGTDRTRTAPGHTARVPSSRYETKVRNTFPHLDQWGQRFRTPFVPEPGSELAEDDTDWQWTPVSQVAFLGMGAARDHLQAVRVHVEADEFFPFAQQTLLRAAILAAAQAVWVLAPDDRKERLQRARTFALENLKQHLAFLRDLQALSPTPHAATDAVERHAAQRRAELADLRAAAGQGSLPLNATDVIQQAVLATWGSREMATEARVEWRRGSGAAHGLPWSLLGRQETRQAGAADAHGIATFHAGGSIDALANSYLCAHGLLANAFKLLDRRGTRP
jgi:hypothetical protein